MKKQLLKAVAVGLVATGFMAQANATTIYTLESSFVPHLESGYYLNDFNDLDDLYESLGTSISYSSSGYSYTISSGDGLYAINGAISTITDVDPLLVTFTSGNVTAVGGTVFLTDYNGDPISGTVEVTLSDGTTISTPAGTFVGFTSPGPLITSIQILSLSAGDDNHYPTLDHLYVGKAVPDGGLTILLLGIGMLGLGGIRRMWD